MKAIILGLILALVVIGGAGGAHAQNFAGTSTLNLKHIDWDLCHGDNCFVYNTTPQLNKNGTFAVDNSNKAFTIILPDGSCNLVGQLDKSSGICDKPQIVLSASDFVRLQHDVAFMAVINIADTSGGTNADFCPLANFIWAGQTADYQQKLLVPTNLYNLVVPVDCQTSPPPVPEFGPIAAIVMAIATLSVVVVAAKTRVIPRF